MRPGSAVIWYVKAKGSDGSAYAIICHTPKQAREVAADQRSRGRWVWIEDTVGKEIDETSFKQA